MSTASRSTLTSARKAAVLLALLDDDASTEICKHLGKEELRLLAREISELDEITPELAATVLQEYQSLSTTPASAGKGGPDHAARLVVRALGDEASRPLVRDVIRAKETTNQNLEALEKADPKQLAKLIAAGESTDHRVDCRPSAPTSSKAVLMALPDEVRIEAIKRLAQMQNFSPEIVSKISGVLCRKLKSFGEQDRRAYGGVKAVADLLNQLDGKITTSILETIEKDSGSLALLIRNQMFTFEDFTEVSEAGLRELLSHVDKKTLATSLKSASESLQGRIFGCMSSRAVEMMKEDMEALGQICARKISIRLKPKSSQQRGSWNPKGKLLCGTSREKKRMSPEIQRGGDSETQSAEPFLYAPANGDNSRRARQTAPRRRREIQCSALRTGLKPSSALTKKVSPMVRHGLAPQLTSFCGWKRPNFRCLRQFTVQRDTYFEKVEAKWSSWRYLLRVRFCIAKASSTRSY